MSQALTFAHARGWNLATTLMACITVFHTGDDDFGVMPSAKFDGDPAAIIHEFDPFSPPGPTTPPGDSGNRSQISPAARDLLRLYSLKRNDAMLEVLPTG